MLDIIDSAVKIGLGALIAGGFSYLTLKKNQAHEITKRAEDTFYQRQKDRRECYVEFVTKSDSLIQKYQYLSCSPDSEDYIDYTEALHEVLILSPEKIQELSSELFNAVTEFVIPNFDSNDDIALELKDKLRVRVKEYIFKFHILAKQDVTKNYNP